MAAVVLDVQWERVGAKQFVLQMPRLGMLGPADQGILIQPRIEPLLTLVRECHPLAAADPTQRIVAHWCQQGSERQPQRRTFSVPLQMVGDTLAEMLAAALVLWRYADVQQG